MKCQLLQKIRSVLNWFKFILKSEVSLKKKKLCEGLYIKESQFTV